MKGKKEGFDSIKAAGWCLKKVCDANGIQVPNHYFVPMANLCSDGSIANSIVQCSAALGFSVQELHVEIKDLSGFNVIGSNIFILNSTHCVFAYRDAQANLIIEDCIQGVVSQKLFLEKCSTLTVLQFSLTDNLRSRFDFHSIESTALVESVEQVCQSLVAHYFSWAQCYGITGSYSKGNFTEQSDIDVIIISDLIAESGYETFRFKGYRFDVHFFSKHTLPGMIYSDVRARKGILLDKLRSISILRDEEDFLKLWREKSNVLFAVGPPFIKDGSFFTLRAKILSDLADLKGGLNREQAIIVVGKMIELVVNFHSIIHRYWFFRGKFIPSNLQRRYPIFFQDLFQSIEVYYRNNDLVPYIKQLEILIEATGSGFQKFSNWHATTGTHSKLVVGLSGTSSFSDLLEFVDQVVPETLTNKYFFFKFCREEFEQIQYVIVFDHSDEAYALCATLQKRFQKITAAPLKAVITFPLEIDRVEFQNYLSLEEAMLNHFKEISRIVQRIFDKEKSSANSDKRLSLLHFFNVILKRKLSKPEQAVNWLELDQIIFKEFMSEHVHSRRKNYFQLSKLYGHELNEFEALFNGRNPDWLFPKYVSNARSPEYGIIEKAMSKRDFILDLSALGNSYGYRMFYYCYVGVIAEPSSIDVFYQYRFLMRYIADVLGVMPKEKSYYFYTLTKSITVT